MLQYVKLTAALGAACMGAMTFVAMSCVTLAFGGFLGGWIIILPFFLLGYTIGGAMVGGCIFAIAGVLAYLVRGRYVSGALAFAILGGMISIPFSHIPFDYARWQLLEPFLRLYATGSGLPALLATSVAGAFVGSRLNDNARSGNSAGRSKQSVMMDPDDPRAR